MTYAVPVYLPAYVGTALLSALASRRVPALRPVAVCFAAWAALDAITGPLWLRAGVLVTWPGAAVACAAWGLKDEGPGPLRDPSPSGRGCQPREVLLPASAVVPASGGGAVSTGRYPVEGRDSGGPLASVLRHFSQWADALLKFKPTSRIALWQAISLVYLLAGLISAIPYALGYRQPYHLALPLSRALPVALAALALATGRYPRTWAQRAAVAPAAGLVCGVVLGVWTLLPDGLAAVREQWARLAGAETWATLTVTAGCVVMAWIEARRSRVR